MSKSKIKLYPLLYPFAFLYGIGVSIRNWLFDRKWLPSERFPIPVICIGNLAVGGTGKTPFVEYLIRLLSDKYRIAVLSRGYKRKTSGFVLANSTSVVSDIGDEACQIKFKFPHVTVAVDKDRRRAMRQLLAMPEDVRPQLVLLDDGFQHRYIQPLFSIILTEYNRPFFKDKLLPVGRLREPVKRVERVHMVVVSKCPNTSLWPADYKEIIENVTYWVSYTNLFFAANKYKPLEGVFPEKSQPCDLNNIQNDDEILLITGIANPTSLIEKIKAYAEKVSVLTFSDHHAFTKKDIQTMQAELSKMKSKTPLIICTEKDAARIRNNPLFPDEWKSRMYYLPIETYLIPVKNPKFFKEQIMENISSMVKDFNIQSSF